MNVTIQQDELSTTPIYEISAPGCIYTARKVSWWPEKLVLTGPRERVLARITGGFAFLGSTYDFELDEGAVFHFRCEKFWKGVFVCESSDQHYRLYQHKDLNYSVFQGDRQIAAFTSNHLIIGAGNRCEIRMNDDANLIVIVCMALVSEDDDNHATVTYDFGNIGPEERPFDESWEPE